MTRPKTHRYVCDDCGLEQEIEVAYPAGRVPHHRHQSLKGGESWHPMTEQPLTPEEAS